MDAVARALAFALFCLLHSSLAARISTASCDVVAPTLQAARLAVRNSSLFRVKPITACVQGSDPESVDGPLTFTAQDSGTASARISYIALDNSSLVTGAVPVALQPLDPNDPIRAYVSAIVASNLLVVSLPALNITDWGKPRTDGGCSFGCGVGPLQLLLGDGSAHPARWPNADPSLYGGPWAQTATAPNSTQWVPTAGKFYWDSLNPGAGLWGSVPDILAWPDTIGLFAHGYWYWDWDETYQPIASVQPVPGSSLLNFSAGEPVYKSNFTTGARFYLLNHASLLDVPGEMHLNYTSGMLYYYPFPDDDLDSARVTVADTVLDISSLQYVTFQGFTIEGARNNAVLCVDCVAVTIISCTVRLTGGVAVSFFQSNSSVVDQCHVYNTGGGGVHFSSGGGNRTALVSAGNAIRNSHVHHFERQCLTYSQGVVVDYAGTIEHNEVHDSGHACGGFSGAPNDALVQYNIFHHCTMDTFDNAAFYWSPMDWTIWNVTHRYNLFYENGGLNTTCTQNTNMVRSSIYMDNVGAGWNVYGNVIWQREWPLTGCPTCRDPSTATRFATINDGGRSSTMFNNIIVDANGTLNAGAEITWDKNAQTNSSSYYERMRAVGWNTGVYASAYPDLAQLHDYYTSSCVLDPLCPAAPWNNSIVTNILVNSSALAMLTPSYSGFNNSNFNTSNNWFTADPGFVSSDPRGDLDFQLRPDSPAYSMGFQRIPMECFGICACGRCD